jgi:hypothetical protein
MTNETKPDKNEIPDVNREGLSIEQITDEATNKSSDETLRQVLRGDETKGDADDRDIVGGVNSNETPHGREEAKKDEIRSNS